MSQAMCVLLTPYKAVLRPHPGLMFHLLSLPSSLLSFLPSSLLPLLSNPLIAIYTQPVAISSVCRLLLLPLVYLMGV